MADNDQIDVPIGSKARVEIVKTPSNAAALKTLRRVLAKDPATAYRKRRDKEARARGVRIKTRGGRPWAHRTTMRPVIEGAIGDSGTLDLTADVLRDLNSVSRFVKVTKA